MSETKTLEQVRTPAPREASLPAVSMGFGSLQSFELMQRAAKLLANSTLVPTAYRMHKEIKEYGAVTGFEENPNALSNCVVALNMAQRMGADPLMVMQNLYIVEGRPSWSSQFIIAAINSCGRYSALRFEMSAPGPEREIPYTATEWLPPAGNPNGKKVKTAVQKTVKIRDRTCVAWAIEKETGQRLESPVISVELAVTEGWLTKNGSKWQTMPEVMLRYRAASFFGKIYAPELLMGIQTEEEVRDIIDVTPDAEGSFAADIEFLRGSAPKAPAGDDSVPKDEPAQGAHGANDKPAPNASAATGAPDLLSEQDPEQQAQNRRQRRGGLE